MARDAFATPRRLVLERPTVPAGGNHLTIVLLLVRAFAASLALEGGSLTDRSRGRHRVPRLPAGLLWGAAEVAELPSACQTTAAWVAEMEEAAEQLGELLSEGQVAELPTAQSTVDQHDAALGHRSQGSRPRSSLDHEHSRHPCAVHSTRYRYRSLLRIL